ncbi:hypothetical protein L218DRAFT_986102 [Marasmius fiardii PR-910]|nr:hypothetical protein L218DRAFT_986102 [Marasmius fiardii PR-910]
MNKEISVKLLDAESRIRLHGQSRRPINTLEITERRHFLSTKECEISWKGLSKEILSLWLDLLEWQSHHGAYTTGSSGPTQGGEGRKAGRRVGKRGKSWKRTPEEVVMSRGVEKVAQELGAKSITSVAIAYVIQKTTHVFPVIGGRKVEQLKQNVEALDICHWNKSSLGEPTTLQLCRK